MVANLILTKRVGNIDKDFDLAWEYLNKAIELKSVAALNTMGNCYLNGLTPEKKKDEEKALEYYKMAAEEGYVFAYNNIGLYYERHNNIDEALKNFDLSASLGDSWALNKIGEYYRLKGDFDNAYYYYHEASLAPISNRNNYALYNLAKYYFLDGSKKDLNMGKNYAYNINYNKDGFDKLNNNLETNRDIDILKRNNNNNLKKAKEYLEIASESGIKEAKELLEKEGL